ncbi:electron transfer flavoprotein subunit beta/FixA family protein [Rubrolithibacter danxiaensis]|uniref:electron transfer flavoprotein subunit beta/FixA family protein n=1 Tax=Rubrolithibacter danxiaensis TaxID=3390805 RepID=UPI003BF8B8D2
MKVLVCISNVPDTTTKITFTNDNTQFSTAGVQYILNPYDEIALSKGIELCEGGKGTLTVINVGEANTEPTIRKALATGADDAVRINAFPADGFFVANQIADFVKDKDYDLILTGRESIDYNGSQVAAMLGELLQIPSISIIKKLDYNGTEFTIEREIEGGKEVLTASASLVVSCTEGTAEPRIPNMRGIMSARTKPLQVIEPVETPFYTHYERFESPPQKGAVKILAAEETEKLVELLHTETKAI